MDSPIRLKMGLLKCGTWSLAMPVTSAHGSWDLASIAVYLLTSGSRTGICRVLCPLMHQQTKGHGPACMHALLSQGMWETPLINTHGLIASMTAWMCACSQVRLTCSCSRTDGRPPPHQQGPWV